MSELAEQLLQLHARIPSRIFYGIEVLGSMFRDSAVQRLDEAYLELVTQRLMEPSGSVLSYFGAPKVLYRVTREGLDHATRHQRAA